MAQEFPLLKLVGLLVKTLAKPISKRLKHDCSRYEFTQNLLVGIGRGTHAITSRMTIWSAGYKVRSINPLEREEALNRGAEFLSESFVFLVGGTVIVLEYNRNREKERVLEAARHNELVQETEKLQIKLNAVDERLAMLESMMKLERDSLGSLKEQQDEEMDMTGINTMREQVDALRDESEMDNEVMDNAEMTQDTATKKKIWWWPF